MRCTRSPESEVTLSRPGPQQRQRIRSPSPLDSHRHPALCSMPLPTSWTPAELPIQISYLPRLPPLPPQAIHQVFMHKSAAGTRPEEALLYESISYKPLEFFGDAVVEYEVSRLLRKRLPLAGPGVLTHLRSKLVDNRTLGILGWGLGLAPHVRFGKGSQFAGDHGRNCPQRTVAEVLEAHLGALGEDEGSSLALKAWFEEVLGTESRVFPDLTKEAVDREAKMAESVRRKSSGGRDRINPSTSSSLTRFECECVDRKNSAQLFTLEDHDHSANLQRGGAYWHTTLSYNGQKLACARGGKRLDARQEVWATALAATLESTSASNANVDRENGGGSGREADWRERFGGNGRFEVCSFGRVSRFRLY